jgi:hypothetical protein
MCYALASTGPDVPELELNLELVISSRLEWLGRTKRHGPLLGEGDARGIALVRECPEEPLDMLPSRGDGAKVGGLEEVDRMR